MEGRIVPAKSKYNFFTKSLIPGSGFPDFIAYKKINGKWNIIGVEAKSAKYLDKDEKAKCKWYLEHGTFDKIIIMYKDKKGHIDMYEFEEGDNGQEETKNIK